jgi:hypothetical protein
MKSLTIKNGAFGLGALALVMSIIMSGLMLAPSSASAFWWPWGNHHVYAQGNNNEEVTVTIQKYIDGEPATSDSAGGNAFPMTASWDDPDGIGDGSGSYELSADNSYTAETSEMHTGADYSTTEVLDGDVVAASCDSGHPYMLAGYSVGASAEAAASADVTASASSLTNLSSDQYIIVWNESCNDDNGDGDMATSTGNISGEVTGGQSEEEPGSLEVTSVDAQKTTAVANGEFADGWQYVFNITVPTDEPNLAMKFANWMQTDGDHAIPVANNMRISSDQASATSTITLSAADTYSSPDLHMTGDLNAEEDGLQVQVLVEMAVPADTHNGTYSTEYGVRTLP